MIGPSEPCDAFQRQTARIAELEAALAAERGRREAAEAELRNIANAKPSEWGEDVRDQFRPWAQSRARNHFARHEKD